ncbi:MAG: isoprenylcysteine carboxylmethyltransferase family protein [Pseudomonadota bacterium]
MSVAIFFIAFLVVQRLSELVLAKRNTQRLLERGAYEVGAWHYPLMVAVHGAFVVAIAVFGNDQSVNPFFLAVYALLQVFRIWILTSLGERWTTRIIIIDEPLIARGPYRFLKHPNYVLVVGEIFVAPMVLGLFWVAVVFTILNAGLLAIRIPAENAALAKIGK